MKSQARGAGFRSIQQAAYTLMSKSSLCVAMGTRATFTEGVAKELETQKLDKEERTRKKTAGKGRRSWWGIQQRTKRERRVRHIKTSPNKHARMTQTAGVKSNGYCEIKHCAVVKGFSHI